MGRWIWALPALLYGVACLGAEQERSNATFVGDALLVKPQHLDNRQALLDALAAEGYTGADAYRIALRDTGGLTLLVRFRVHDPAQARDEAVALFRALGPHIAATGLIRVAFDASRTGRARSADRFTHLFWRKYNGDWTLLGVAPRDYFTARLAEAPPAAAGERAYARLMLANLDVSRGRDRAALQQLTEAVTEIEAAPGTPVPAAVELGVYAALMQHAAAGLADDGRFERWLQRYALLLGERGWSADQQPVYRAAPELASIRRDGFVELEFDIDATGRPVNVEVLNSQPPGLYDEVTVAAMERSRFLPRVENGQLVPARVRYRWGYQRMR